MPRTTKKNQKARDERESDIGTGFLGGLTNLIEKLGELAEKGKELQEVREFGNEGMKGVYGFTIRTNLGGPEGNKGVKVEPFGNVRQDKSTGRATVHEINEPPVDIFEESDHVLVVAELPGVGAEDVSVEVEDDILTLKAEKGRRKYQKEVLLPTSFRPEQMTYTCKNGMLEIKLQRGA